MGEWRGGEGEGPGTVWVSGEVVVGGGNSGDCGYGYIQVQSVALYHHGNLEHDTADYEKYCSVSKTFDLSVCEQLVAVFGPSPVSPLSSAQPPPPPILSLAMEVQLDQAHSTKVT